MKPRRARELPLPPALFIAWTLVFTSCRAELLPDPALDGDADGIEQSVDAGIDVTIEVLSDTVWGRRQRSRERR